MSSLNKGLGKVEVGIKWDPSPMGEPDHDLDLVAAAYTKDRPQGEPDYLVHFDSRLSPDGTITLNRDSRDGRGFGFDEIMYLELHRLAERYTRVLVGVGIQQQGHRLTFGMVRGTGLRIRGEKKEILLATDDFTAVAEATAAIVAEFRRDDSGAWQLDAEVRGFDADLASFTHMMGRPKI